MKQKYQEPTIELIRCLDSVLSDPSTLEGLFHRDGDDGYVFDNIF